jgi:chaperonin GroEL
MIIKKIGFEKETQEKVEAGVNAVYQVAAAAYGAKGGDVILEMQYSDPKLSRDGVTNVDQVFLEDRVENAAARLVVQASKKNNETVGDGTTLAVILTKHFLDKARHLVGSGQDRMSVSENLLGIIPDIHDKLDKISKKYNAENLEQVAIVSAGDEATGQLIADTIAEVGLDGGVVVERHAGIGIYNELQDGFYFNKGFTNAWLINNRVQLRAEHTDANILIAEKPISGMHEMAQILEACGNSNIKRLVIIGEVSGDAMSVAIQVHLKQLFDITIIEPANFAGGRSLFLEDLAVFTGGQVYTEGMSSDSFDTEMLGKATKVVVNEFSTSIIGGQGDKTVIADRIKSLKKDLKDSKDPRSVEAIQERLGKLTGKIGIIRVGGATPADAEYTKLRVDDAVCAVRSAMRSGVLPGGGVALIRCKDVAHEFADALEMPFKQLFTNAGLNAERYLSLVENAHSWYGFDLNNISEKPQDMLEIGIVDPLEVIQEAVTNSATMAARLIRAKAAIINNDDVSVSTDN